MSTAPYTYYQTAYEAFKSPLLRLKINFNSPKKVMHMPKKSTLADVLPTRYKMRHAVNFTLGSNDIEPHNDIPSTTIPDQAISVPELMRRWSNGLPLTGGREPVYSDSEIDLNRMDYSEIEDLQRANAEVIERSKRRQKQNPSKESKPDQGTEVLETIPTSDDPAPKV
ncbi:hypothetical protein [Blackfly microvirus SF02]|uniref:Uncharacterized protein n=1 Tax=Blackfly microvirus SF02 TaxID=2576452 RepID=A0A4P8PJU6_9VIRU|nr:hypothetical protein [Blackfly microvirus SF02]